MFGFLKKKGDQDNGDPRLSKAKSQPVPRSPWDEAVALMEQGKTAEALEQFARTAIQTRDLSRMDLAERWLNDQRLLDRAGEEVVCRFVAFLPRCWTLWNPINGSGCGRAASRRYGIWGTTLPPGRI